MQSSPFERACALIAVLVLAWGMAACSTPDASTGAAREGTARGLQRGDFRLELLLTGELEAVQSLSIKAPQTNQFQMRIQFMAEEGLFVEAGEPILDFDNSALAEQARDLESRILDAEMQIVSKRNELASTLKDLEIELAEREYEFGRTRLEAAIDEDVISRKEFGERQLAFSRASRELDETRKRVSLTETRGQAELDVLTIDRNKLRRDLQLARQSAEKLSIVAPADGLVVYETRQNANLRYQEGDSCWPGQAIMRLPDLSEMQAVFLVHEVEAPSLRVGMPLRISVDSFPGRELTGEIVNIPSMAVKRDDSSQISIFKITARLSETWVGDMKPGMSVLGRVVVDERLDVPLLPRENVSFDGSRYRWVGGPGREPVEIEPVARNDRFYVLSETEFERLGGGAVKTASGRKTAGGDS